MATTAFPKTLPNGKPNYVIITNGCSTINTTSPKTVVKPTFTPEAQTYVDTLCSHYDYIVNNQAREIQRLELLVAAYQQAEFEAEQK